MSERKTFDFRNVGVIKDTQILRPGEYSLAIKDAKYVKPEDKKADGSTKSPYLDITFAGESGQLSNKFYVTDKTFDRIHTLYVQWFGKQCDKTFDSIDAVGAFFELAFNSDKAKSTFKRMIIGGKTGTNGKVYSEIPYSKYLISDNDPTFKEGAFEPGTGKYIQYVGATSPNPSTNTNDVIIPGTLPSHNSNDFSDDLPF